MVRFSRTQGAAALFAFASFFLVTQLTIQAGHAPSDLQPQLAGALDKTFGSAGTVVTSLPGSRDSARAVAIQPDRKIVAAGFFSPPSSTDTNGQNPAIVRYNADGSLDTGFGVNGLAALNFAPSQFSGFQLIAFTAIALQTDGSIIAGGPGLSPHDFQVFGLVRFTSNGALDISFGNQGLAFADFNSFVSHLDAITVQADGSIIAAGGDFSPFTSGDFAVARFTSAGALDNTFGSGGMITTDFFGLPDEAQAVAVQPDGRIIVAGTATAGSTQSLFALVRYNPDGTLDSSFGLLGKEVTGFIGSVAQANSVAVLSGGGIIAGGFATDSNGIPDFALIQFTPRGVPDAGFGDNGKVTTSFFGAGDAIKQVLVQADGNIIAAGFATNGSNTEFAAARYHSDGSLDTGFGENGRSAIGFSGQGSEANAAALQADGNIVLAGFASSGSNTFDFALARIQGGPGADFSLGLASQSITLQRPSRTTVTIQIDRVGGFAGQVTVTAPSSLPAGVKLIGANSVQTSGATAEFTIKVKRSALAGTDQLVFTGTDTAGQTHNVQLTLVIQ